MSASWRDVSRRLYQVRGIHQFVEAIGINYESDWTWEEVCTLVASLIEHKDSPDDVDGEWAHGVVDVLDEIRGSLDIIADVARSADQCHKEQTYLDGVDYAMQQVTSEIQWMYFASNEGGEVDGTQKDTGHER